MLENALFFEQKKKTVKIAEALEGSSPRLVSCYFVCVCSTRLLSRDESLLFQNRKQKRHP